LTSLTDTPLLNTVHNSSRRDKGQLKAKKLKTVFIQHTVNKITLLFTLSHFVSQLWTYQCSSSSVNIII